MHNQAERDGTTPPGKTPAADEVALEHRVAHGHRLRRVHLAVAILLVVTRMNLSESSALGQEIDEVLVPSLGALEQLDQTLADSRVCINHWLTRQSRAEDEEKVLLRAIVDRKLLSRWPP